MRIARLSLTWSIVASCTLLTSTTPLASPAGAQLMSRVRRDNELPLPLASLLPVESAPGRFAESVGAWANCQAVIGSIQAYSASEDARRTLSGSTARPESGPLKIRAGALGGAEKCCTAPAPIVGALLAVLHGNGRLRPFITRGILPALLCQPCGELAPPSLKPRTTGILQEELLLRAP
jgi:hypothetical protein